MNFKEYQALSRKTAIYPRVGEKFVYPVLGLLGEAGEVAEKVKKIFRDKKGKVDRETRENLVKELGDVLWYVTQVASEFELSLDEIAARNIEKLASRKERGVLRGSGDER